GDGVVSGLQRQSPADASYNVQEMLRLLAAQGVSIGACRTCLEARGIDDAALVAGINRRTLDDLQNRRTRRQTINCSAGLLPQLTFSFYRHQPIRAGFSGGQITSDAGLLPLRAFDQRHHLTSAWAAA